MSFSVIIIIDINKMTLIFEILFIMNQGSRKLPSISNCNSGVVQHHDCIIVNLVLILDVRQNLIPVELLLFTKSHQFTNEENFIQDSKTQGLDITYLQNDIMYQKAIQKKMALLILRSSNDKQQVALVPGTWPPTCGG